MIDGFQVRPTDLALFQKEFDPRLPSRIIDAHVHLYNLKSVGVPPSEYETHRRYKPWSDFILNETFPYEDYVHCCNEMFPGHTVSGMFMGLPFEKANIDATNAYVMQVAKDNGTPFFYIPTQFEDLEETNERLDLLHRPGFIGFKPYPDLVQGAHGECSIYDMLNHSALRFAHEHELLIMLHIPKREKFRDPENRRALVEIATTYKKARIIIAHVGRAFVFSDADGLIDFLTEFDNIWFDTACVNDPRVYEYLFRIADPSRVLYASDASVSFYRGRDVELNGKHYFITDRPVPWGFGTENEDIASNLTFILYEELRAAFWGLDKVYGSKVDKFAFKFFYENAKELLKSFGF